VLRAIGPRHALRYFQSAERISAQRAQAIGLVSEVLPAAQIDAAIAELAQALTSGGPQALIAAKDLIASVNGRPMDESLIEETAQRISRQRATDEAKNGISAFLEKRPPAWLS
jgi:methylglutaconyl-CoA hydratase